MLAFLMAATLQVTAGSAAEFPVTFTQDDARWPVIVNANGVVTPDGDALVVRLRGVEVADQPANANTIPYVSYRVCLARKATETPWETAGCSDAVKIRSMPQGDETLSLPAQQLKVPAAGAASLEDYWLVLEMVSRPVQGRTYSVPSHSQPSLFVAVGDR
jgi:hypothetical protein